MPTTASVFLGQMQQFTATVTNTTNLAVNWSVNAVPGGNSSVGTIIPATFGADTATYTAPQILPLPASVTITATSQSGPTPSGSVTVQIRSDVAVNIAPTLASLATNASQSFTANVSGTGSPDLAVTWSVNGTSGGNSAVGTVAPTGTDAATYIAPPVPSSPPTVSVTATSIADPSKSATASVTITCASSGSLSPPAASMQAGATQVFSASLCVPPGTAIVWDVNGVVGGDSTIGTIIPSSSNPSVAMFIAPVAVPASNPVTIQASASGQSASAKVTINAPPIAVTVSPSSASVVVGQRATFVAAVSGTSNLAVTWTVNGVANGNSATGQVCAPSSNPCSPPTGNETNVDFLAPSSQPQPSTVVLVATSVVNPMSTGSAQITITPPPKATVSVAPFYTFLDPSQQFQFLATVSGSANQSVTWGVSSAVPGQGCVGISCGAIDGAGNYTAPVIAPSPNAISIIATSAADTSASATATVALLSGPVIETILPSSVLAGAPIGFLLAVQGLNFTPSTSTGSSQILINGSPRSTNCPISGRCTTTLGPADVSTAGIISVQVANPGVVPALSNPVSVVVLAPTSSPGIISLMGSLPLATGENIIVTEPTTAGATPSPINVDFAGPMSPDGTTCTIQGSPIIVTRPTSGSATTSICVHGNYLDPTLTYAFSAPSTGGDIGVVPSALTGLFPNLIELTLTFFSSTVPGVRALFITTPNGDTAVATALLEVK
ncbi:MAG TPA: hypothetical protein VGR72_08480 [Candidatus Acidoferrales bacterium]|nr:hypothetical protein [Candidatus Acidoferrales bacterium]